MTRYWASALAFGLLLSAPHHARAQGKVEPGGPATEADYKEIAKSKDAIGKLASSAGKTVTIVIDHKSVSVDQAKLQALQQQYLQQMQQSGQQGASAIQQQASHAQRMAQLQQQYMQIFQTTNPQQRAQRMQQWMVSMQQLQMQMAQQGNQQAARLQQQMMQQMQKAQQSGNANSPYKVESNLKTYEFNVRDDVIVRRMTPAFGYDDKGNLKQYTPAELQKLKGTNPKLPGYQAKLEDLEPGSTVQVFIAAPKEGKVGEVDLVGNIIRPEVRMIVLAADESVPAAGGIGGAIGLPKQ